MLTAFKYPALLFVLALSCVELFELRRIKKPFFAGKSFVSLSELLYMNYEIVLFALEVEDLKNEKVERKTLLNPADFIIPSKNDYKIQVKENINTWKPHVFAIT